MIKYLISICVKIGVTMLLVVFTGYIIYLYHITSNRDKFLSTEDVISIDKATKLLNIPVDKLKEWEQTGEFIPRYTTREGVVYYSKQQIEELKLILLQKR